LHAPYSVEPNLAPTAQRPTSAHNFASRGAAGSDKLTPVVAALSDQEQSMAIDFSAVNWLYVVIMAVFAFVASLLGGLISFRNRIGGALLAAILFAAMYVVWNYYPHPQIQLPIVPPTAYSTPSGG
jgi:lipopolysaccharide export LptBFGC system permease protein LptF